MDCGKLLSSRGRRLQNRFLVAVWLVAILAPACLETLASEPFDPGRAAGEQIQVYRAQIVPREYPAPSRCWIYADVLVLTGLLLSGMWLVRRRRPSRWISAQLAIALLYLGIFRGGCICPVGATADVFLALYRPALVGVSTLALFLLPLVVALLSGRIFCGTVCPLGAVQQLISSKKPWPLPRWLHRLLLGLPWIILVGTAGEVCQGLLPCRLDPYKPVFFQAHAAIQKLATWLSLGHAEPGWILACNWSAWGLLGIALVAGWFIPRVFCRYVCPYGVLLGGLSAVGFWRREIDQSVCLKCNCCAKSCPVQAIEPSAKGEPLKLSSYQCIQCGRCTEACKKHSV